MITPLAVLCVEDSEDDTLLLTRLLTRNGYTVTYERVDTAAALTAALDQRAWDVIVADYMLPQWSGLAALRLIRARDPDVPVLIVSGQVGEEIAVEVMRAGAQDFIGKSNLARLAPALARELAEAQERRQRQAAERTVREHEARFRDIVETAHEGIWVLDAAGATSYANRQLGVLLGVPVETLRECMWTEFLAPDDQACRDSIARLVQGTGERFECHLRRADGVRVWVLVSAAPCRDADGLVVGSLLMVTDLTAHKRAEAEVRKAERLQALSRLAGGIAHDFRNYLTVVLGKISLVKMDLTPDELLYSRLTSAEGAALRAKELSEQLLTFAEGGAPVKRPTSIAELLREATTFALRGTNVSAIFQVADDLWPLEADPGQVGEVIHNVVVNAAEAMPTGGAVTVMARNLPVDEAASAALPGPCVEIIIQDEGVGIAPDDLPMIFDPFFSRKGIGDGLGLTTAYSIVRSHDGTLHVSSRIGEGTTCTLRLPAAPSLAVPPHVAFVRPQVHKGRILVMDDEDFVRECVVDMLAALGYDAQAACEGEEAIRQYMQAQAAGHPFDAVILDLTVRGGLGGKDTISRLQAFDPQVRAIVTSGYSQDPILADHKHYGFCNVIPKPYRLDELCAVVLTTLGESSVPESPAG